MRIRTQFILSMVIFSVLLLAIAVSIVITNQQIAQLDSQQDVSGEIEQVADELNTLSSSYFLYQLPQDLISWQSNINFIQSNLSKLNPTSSEQQKLVQLALNDLGRLNSSFTDIVAFLETAPRNVSVRIIPEFQDDWNRMVSEHQTLAIHSSALSESLRFQTDQFRQTNMLLIVALSACFGVFLLTNYLITYRRTLKSISNLQAGIDVIGSGNLDYVVAAEKNDEVGALSSSFNQMTTRLKTVTASKDELEREVADRKRAEKELEASRAGLEREGNILQAVMDSPKNMYLVYLDPDFNFVRVNKAYADTCGYTPEEMIGKNHFALYANEENETIFARVRDTGKAETYHDKPFVFPDQPERGVTYWDWTLEPVKDKAGKTEGLVFSLMETTERRRTEEKLEKHGKDLEEIIEERTRQLRDAERMAAIGQTAGMVGHDIRNPLQAIIGDVFLAKADLASIPKSSEKASLLESLEAIEKNADYINKIVADLQDFAKPLNPRTEETDLESIIDDLLTKNGLPGNVEPSVKLKREATKVSADSAYVRRIIGNLVSNAVQAMPNGGDLRVATHREAENVILTVEDTGVGIPESAKSKLFTPLFTTKSKGQGFGLAVVKRLTEALDGSVTFESEEGKGTKFIVRLPSIKNDKR